MFQIPLVIKGINGSRETMFFIETGLLFTVGFMLAYLPNKAKNKKLKKIKI
jgi:hypothetical protein